jgi:hypothetical protein
MGLSLQPAHRKEWSKWASWAIVATGMLQITGVKAERCCAFAEVTSQQQYTLVLYARQQVHEVQHMCIIRFNIAAIPCSATAEISSKWHP